MTTIANSGYTFANWTENGTLANSASHLGGNSNANSSSPGQILWAKAFGGGSRPISGTQPPRLLNGNVQGKGLSLVEMFSSGLA